MNRPPWVARMLGAGLVLFLLLSLPSTFTIGPHSAAAAKLQRYQTSRSIGAVFADLPLSFEANQGQADAVVRFLSRSSASTVFLTPGEIVLVLHRAHGTSPVLRLQFVGANRAGNVVGLDALPGTANYFVGTNPARWHAGISTYGRVQYQDIYPGIDAIFFGNHRQLEYDLVVAPGADPTVITLDFEGADGVAVDARGDLVVQVSGVEVRHSRPAIYQIVGGMRRQVAGWYVPVGSNQVTIRLAAYDTTKPLVIDPVLAYSTYLGGGFGDLGTGIAVDAAGNAYVTGETQSVNFPTVNASQPALRGAIDVFVAKLDPTGSALVYSTYLGGDGDDLSRGIALDASGNVYVTGGTSSANFPALSAIQSAFGGGIADAFITKLVAGGSAIGYSTYLGGTGFDEGRGIAVDAAGSVYVTGRTSSVGFSTAGSFQSVLHGSTDAFVAKLEAGEAAPVLAYSTYLGGSGSDIGQRIAVDGDGNAYITGRAASFDFPTANALQASLGGGSDAFVTKLDASGATLLYSTYLGGSGSELGQGIAVDGSGNAYVAGLTNSIDFPTANAAQVNYGGGDNDVFVSKLDTAGTAMLFSTYLGGTGVDEGTDVAVDGAGSAYVTGRTSSVDFPTANALQPGFGGGTDDAFVAKLSATGVTEYSTYLGGSDSDDGRGIAVDGAGSAYVTGQTASPNFPVANAAQPTLGGSFDAYVARIVADLDTAPPDTTIVSGPEQGSLSNSTQATFEFTGVDNGTDAPLLAFHCSLDGGVFAACASPQTYSGLSDGAHSFAVRAVDESGNLDPTPATRGWTVDTAPPDLSLTVTPQVLWPPSHQMVEVNIAAAASDASGIASIVLISATSSEPDNSGRDGDTSDDIQGADVGTLDASILLRAERSGSGQGRVYTLTYQATDTAGNSTTASATVTVPINHSQAARAPAASVPPR